MNLENFQTTNLGELVYHSDSSGKFMLHEISTINKFGERHPVALYNDCPITIKTFKDCYFSNVNVIHTENEIFSNNGYHFETPAVDISKFKIKSDAHIKAKDGFYTYPATSELVHLDSGFYIGETDNFGHWIFEFLPKVLWYTRLFPKQDLPILVGENVPDRWVELISAFGIDLNCVKRFKTGRTHKVGILTVCSASVKRTKVGPALRAEDFMAIRYMVEKHYKHINYQKSLDCLFSTRQGTLWRKIVNEEEIVDWLSQHFATEIFRPEKLSMKEQLNVIGRTKLFFGTGGSSPISIFQPKDSVFFEVRPPIGKSIVGRAWADLFRFGHHYVKTEFAKNKTASHPEVHKRDLVIDIETFKKEVLRVANNSRLFTR